MRSKMRSVSGGGEIRDRTTEGQHYRIAGLNLLTAVIIYWNTVHLGHAVTERRNEGLDVPLNFFPTYPHWAGRTFY
jgi:TnpA family transposase